MPVVNQVGNALTGSTGTGAFVGQTSPTLITPDIGTPSAGVLTNCTGLPVAGGGTGRASHTAYAVICGGTSTTNPQQSIASVGTAGQVLTSNGAAALPTFQDVAGSVIQLQRTTATTGASSSAVIPTDNSIPQIGEGTEFFTVSITPTNSANTLVIEVFIPLISVSIGGSVSMVGALFVGATANALCVDFGGINTQHMYMKFVTTAGSTSARTYRFRFGPGVAGTAYCNQAASGNLYGSASVAFIQVTELSI